MNWSTLIEAGYLPTLIQEDDPRSAFAQLKDRYNPHIQPMRGFKVHHPQGGAWLTYPGDPIIHEVSRARLRDEVLILFEHSWLLILTPGTETIVRVD